MKYPKNVLDAGISIVKESDPALLRWLAAASKPVTRIVMEEVGGRMRKVQRTQQPHIVIGTGLRAQHMPARALTTTQPLPKEWYYQQNEYNRGFDPFGVYTQSGIELITEFYERQLVKLGATAFVGGGATMADQLMMRAALKLGLRTMLKIPIPTQHATWDKHVQSVYFRQLAQVDLAVLVTDTDELLDTDGKVSKSKVAYAMNRRNRAMLTVAPNTHVTVRRTVLATWRGASGGTKNCIEDAERMKLDVVNVYDKLMVTIGYQKVLIAEDNRITTRGFTSYQSLIKAQERRDNLNQEAKKADLPTRLDVRHLTTPWHEMTGLPVAVRLQMLTPITPICWMYKAVDEAFNEAYQRAHHVDTRPLERSYYAPITPTDAQATA